MVLVVLVVEVLLQLELVLVQLLELVEQLVLELLVPGIVAIISTFWFGIGGAVDLVQMFRDLEKRTSNPLDDGRVEGNVSLADKAQFEAMEKAEAEELHIGDRIHILMVKKGMTQRELAKAARVTEVSMSRYISNNRVPKATIIVAIAKALNVSADVLLGMSPAQPQRTGRWIPTNNESFLQCSECGRYVYAYKYPNKVYPYCHCGADMRGEQDGKNT